MRKLISLFVVAILATSVSFSQVDYCDPVDAASSSYVTVPGLAQIVVVFPCIELITCHDAVEVVLQPGQTSGPLQFQWKALGAQGIGYSLSGLWGTIPAGLQIVHHTNGLSEPPTSPYGANGSFSYYAGLETFYLDFAIYAAPGTQQTTVPHQLHYTLTIDY